jgi:predicted small lipoprotein YifL
MKTSDTNRAATLALLIALLGVGLAGCGLHRDAVEAPASMKVGPPLTDAQAQALEQKRQAHRQPPKGP